MRLCAFIFCLFFTAIASARSPESTQIKLNSKAYTLHAGRAVMLSWGICTKHVAGGFDFADYMTSSRRSHLSSHASIICSASKPTYRNICQKTVAVIDLPKPSDVTDVYLSKRITLGQNAKTSFVSGTVNNSGNFNCESLYAVQGGSNQIGCRCWA